MGERGRRAPYRGRRELQVWRRRPPLSACTSLIARARLLQEGSQGQRQRTKVARRRSARGRAWELMLRARMGPSPRPLGTETGLGLQGRPGRARASAWGNPDPSSERAPILGGRGRRGLGVAEAFERYVHEETAEAPRARRKPKGCSA